MRRPAGVHGETPQAADGLGLDDAEPCALVLHERAIFRPRATSQVEHQHLPQALDAPLRDGAQPTVGADTRPEQACKPRSACRLE
eukprot:8528392-Lingulodinium_polyedra.AAC.1